MALFVSGITVTFSIPVIRQHYLLANNNLFLAISCELEAESIIVTLMSIRETDKGMHPTNLSSEHIPTDNSHHSHHQLPHLKVVAPNLRLR